MMKKYICIKNANHNNLKNISIDIPRNKLTLITGVSGSGKSTLAFDTLYAEGQRRFVESLSSYARQFLERMTKPEVESITGLPPAVAIEQKAPPKNPRSTVGTVTEIYDYVRALYTRIGKTICVECGKEVRIDTPTTISNTIIESVKSTNKNNEKHWNIDDKIYVMFELKEDTTNLLTELSEIEKLGFSRVFNNKTNEIIDINDLKITVSVNIKDYYVLVDRLKIDIKKDEISRFVDSLEVAFSAGTGHIIIKNITKNFQERYSNIYECSTCKIKYEEPEQRLFAFNNPKGACPSCQGAGTVYGIDENLVVPDKTLTLRQHCIHPYRTPATAGVYQSMLKVCNKYDVPIDVSYKDLTSKQKEIIWNGKENYFGIVEYFNYVESKNYRIQNRLIISKYRGLALCRNCGGSRLKLSARQVFINSINIPTIVDMPISDLYDFLCSIKLNDYEKKATELILTELIARTKMLIDIGLEYLSLSRSCQTLSGGEYQRINLSTALGSTLVGTLYVLDEPSIGMHQKDTERLLSILYRLRNIGNTIVVVEHDPEIIRNADFIIDIGPGAGINGGSIVSAGSYNDLMNNEKSLTAKYLNSEIKIDIPTNRRPLGNKKITITEPSENNLKMNKCSIPLHNFVVLTGVSGSGKSTLVNDVLYAGILEHKGRITKDMKLGKFKEMEGITNIHGVEMVDQSPLGRSTRSTPVTYIKAFDHIREVFAQTQAAQQLGLKPGYFSFNVSGGRCEECEGEGYVNIDMQFLPDVKVVCESCGGTRYKKEINDILYKDKSIVNVLEMNVDEAIQHFKGVVKIENKLQLLQSVGLGYLKLGQSSSTLSGGESQRVKLASHIDTFEQSNYLYIFDEPTTGLHLDDIAKLINAINKLIDTGNSVLIIEHNLSIMSVADWIIDLGPEAGNNGGLIVGEGTPENITKLDTHTGKALAQYFKEYYSV